jgi:hypothetical protein
MSNANIPDSAVAAYDADQKRYEAGGEDWSEFIHDHIDHQLWLIKEHGGKISKNMAEVLDTLRVMALEDEAFCEFVEALFWMGREDASFRLKELTDDLLERYCRNYADELQDMFPEEYAEWSAMQ